MARREPHTSKALEGSVLCAPSPVAPAWVVQASERVMPMTHGATPAPRHHPCAGRERLTPRVGGAYRCCAARRPPWMHASRQHDPPRHTPSSASGPRGVHAARAMGFRGRRGAPPRRWRGRARRGGPSPGRPWSPLRGVRRSRSRGGTLSATRGQTAAAPAIGGRGWSVVSEGGRRRTARGFVPQRPRAGHVPRPMTGASGRLPPASAARVWATRRRDGRVGSRRMARGQRAVGASRSTGSGIPSPGAPPRARQGPCVDDGRGAAAPAAAGPEAAD